jgi:hypothetical protein
MGSGPDVIQMPVHFKPWAQGLPDLRKELKTVDQFAFFSKMEKQTLKDRMAQRGLATDQPITLFLTGHGRQLLAVFDLATLQLKAIIPAE